MFFMSYNQCLLFNEMSTQEHKNVWHKPPSFVSDAAYVQQLKPELLVPWINDWCNVNHRCGSGICTTDIRSVTKFKVYVMCGKKNLTIGSSKLPWSDSSSHPSCLVPVPSWILESLCSLDNVYQSGIVILDWISGICRQWSWE